MSSGVPSRAGAFPLFCLLQFYSNSGCAWRGASSHANWSFW